MRYAGIIYNDFAAGPGVAFTFYTQGCRFHCLGCHNPETWSFEGGREFTSSTLSSIIEGLTKNGVERHLAIQGGEPLCPENLGLVDLVTRVVKEALPQTKIYLWTGYLYEELIARARSEEALKRILERVDILIDGPYKQEERDITLTMRGSRNQRIWDLQTGEDNGE